MGGEERGPCACPGGVGSACPGGGSGILNFNRLLQKGKEMGPTDQVLLNTQLLILWRVVVRLVRKEEARSSRCERLENKLDCTRFHLRRIVVSPPGKVKPFGWLKVRIAPTKMPVPPRPA